MKNKKSLCFILILLLTFSLISCQKQNKEPIIPEPIKKTSSYVEKVFDVGDEFTHFYQKREQSELLDGLFGYKNNEVIPIDLLGNYFYVQKENAIYKAANNQKLIQDLSLTNDITIVNAHNEYTVIHENIKLPPNTQNESKINIHTINNDKIISISNADKVFNSYFFENMLYIIVPRNGTNPEYIYPDALGLYIDIIAVDLDTETVTTLGSIEWLAPRGYPIEPLLDFAEIKNELYVTGNKKIFKLQNMALIKTEIEFSDTDGSITSHLATNEEYIFGVKRTFTEPTSKHYLYIWDQNWNVIEKIEIPNSVNEKSMYAESYFREFLYYKDGNIYLVNSQPTLNLETDAFETLFEYYIINLENKEISFVEQNTNSDNEYKILI